MRLFESVFLCSVALAVINVVIAQTLGSGPVIKRPQSLEPKLDRSKQLVKYRYKDPKERPKIIVFGDSVSDTGNFYGMYQFGGYWNDGHFTNGPIWSEYYSTLVDYQLVNYAFAGAVINDSLSDPIPIWDFLPSVQQQIDIYINEKNGPKVSTDITTTKDLDVAIIATACNDLFRMIRKIEKGIIDQTEFITGIANTITTQAELLISDPGGLMVVIWNWMPTELTMSETHKHYQIAKTSTNMFNQILNSWYQSLSPPSKKANVIIADLWNFYHKVTNPRILNALGIDFVDEKCLYTFGIHIPAESCAEPDKHLFYDYAHFSTKIHQVIGAYLVNLVKKNQLGNDDYELTELELLRIIEEFDIAAINSTHNIFSNSDPGRVFNAFSSHI
ncbi:hypothetical protein H4219_002046 [Mycoemilia scoparia]|uniref:Uncharacterized protein n=1 Tax=Mycoemilia scoparia TaxID=417184 RepID=A0A9W8A6Q8_9FUNG|nr:hypothetical protein H4219_002046 [Mycoemilia scoparia]